MNTAKVMNTVPPGLNEYAFFTPVQRRRQQHRHHHTHDQLIEAFSGTHDMIGGKASGLYDEQGNIKRGMAESQRKTYSKWVSKRQERL
jgi:hypothetical protein